MTIIGQDNASTKFPPMDEAAIAPYVSHAKALEWLRALDISKPVIACVGYRRVPQDARVVKAAQAMSDDYQPVLLGISPSSSYQCAVEDGVISVCCPDPWLIFQKLEIEPDDRLTSTLELEAVLLQPIIKALRPVLIHAHDVTGLRCATLIKLWLQNAAVATPLIYDSHEYIRGLHPDTTGRAMMILENGCIDATDGLITVSDSILLAIRGDYGYDKPACVVLNCPPAAAQFTSNMPDLKVRLGLSPDTPLGVWTGSVTYHRGAHIFISALALLTDVHLAFLTSPFGSFFRDLLDFARRLGCEDRVHVVPTVDFRVVPQAIVGADFGFIGFMPHMKNHEFAMPNKLFEYLQGQLPVVVSNLLEMGSFVERHGIGEVFEVTSTASCAAAISRVLGQSRDGYLARLSALTTTYNWEYQASKCEALYATVLGREVARIDPHVELPRSFGWLDEPKWLRVRSQNAVAATRSPISFGSIVLPVDNNHDLQSTLTNDPLQIIAIFKEMNKVLEISGDEQARILFNAAGAALRRFTDGQHRLLLTHTSSVEGGPDEATLDVQLELLEALLRVAQTFKNSGTKSGSRSLCEMATRLCELIAANIHIRVERGGLAAGQPNFQFLLRSQWGVPANFALHARALRILDRVGTRLESATLFSVAGELVTWMRNRLPIWGSHLGEEFPTYSLLLRLRTDGMRQELQPRDFSVIVDNNAVTEYKIEPNRGLVTARINRTSQIARPILRLDLTDVAIRPDSQTKQASAIIKLPVGCEVDSSSCRTQVRSSTGKIVEFPLAVDVSDPNLAICTPDLDAEWHSVRVRRQDVKETNLISGISAAAALFGLTRQSDDYEMLLRQAQKVSELLGTQDEVERRLGWKLASIRKPMQQ